MTIQKFGLELKVDELNLDDLLWLYEHNQNNKNLYATSISGNVSAITISELRKVRRFSVRILFKEWNTETTRCVDEITERFK